jgi:hypothetical protein
MNSIVWAGNSLHEARKAFNRAVPGIDEWSKPNARYGVVLSVWSDEKRDYVIQQWKGDISIELLTWNHTRKEYVKTQWRRVRKTEARKAYDAGRDVVLCPCKLYPFDAWRPAIMANAKHFGSDFAKLVRNFEWQNCTNETGRYTTFYVHDKPARLKRDSVDRLNLRRAWRVTAWRIVDANGADMVRPWMNTRTEARQYCARMGIRLIEAKGD